MRISRVALFALILLNLCQANVHVWRPHVYHLAGVNTESAPIAPINWAEKQSLPRFQSYATLAIISFAIGWMYREGVGAAFYFNVLFYIFLVGLYWLVAGNTHHNTKVWGYGFMNYEPTLSNAGAVSGWGFFMVSFVIIIAFAWLGDAWSRLRKIRDRGAVQGDTNDGAGQASSNALSDNKHSSLHNHFGFGCARHLCCAERLGDEEEERLRFTAIVGMDRTTPASWGDDQTTILDILTEWHEGTQQTVSVFFQDGGLILDVLVAGTIGDYFDDPQLYWLSPCVFVAIQFVEYALYPNYQYGQRGDVYGSHEEVELKMTAVLKSDHYEGEALTNAARWEADGMDDVRRRRHYNKMEWLFMRNVLITTMWLSIAIYYQMQKASHGFERVMYTLTTHEKREAAESNIELEWFSVMCIWFGAALAWVFLWYMTKRPNSGFGRTKKLND